MDTQATILMLYRGIYLSMEQILTQIDGLSADELNWRPAAPESNSLYGIATHAMGSIEQRLIETIAGQAVSRNRDAEFVATGDSAAALRDRWKAVKTRAEELRPGLPDDVLERVIEHNNLGRMTALELLLHVGRHTSEHAGEAQLTRGLASMDARDMSQRV
jgi:hypothetical protein